MASPAGQHVLLDITIILLRRGMDFATVYFFYTAGHILWTASAVLIIHVPGLVIVIGKWLNQENDFKPDGSYRITMILTVLAYPLVIMHKGYQVINSQTDLKTFKHMKIYDGLLGAAFMFPMQLVVMCAWPPISSKMLFMVMSLLMSFISFLWNVAEYHVLYEDNKTNFWKQILLMPYYTSHFLFRSITIASFHIYFYSNVWEHTVIILPVVLNMIFTWRTYKQDRVLKNQHKGFCIFVGGFSSLMAPSLALFYRKTTSKLNVNYFYKRNILSTNLYLGLVIVLFVTFINLKHTNEKNYFKKNHLLGCQSHSNDRTTEFETSWPGAWARGEMTCYIQPCHNQTSLGFLWLLRDGCQREEETPTQARNHSLPDREHFIVTRMCLEAEQPSSGFNYLLVPILGLLGLVSTSLAFYTFPESQEYRRGTLT